MCFFISPAARGLIPPSTSAHVPSLGYINRRYSNGGLILLTNLPSSERKLHKARSCRVLVASEWPKRVRNETTSETDVAGRWPQRPGVRAAQERCSQHSHTRRCLASFLTCAPLFCPFSDLPSPRLACRVQLSGSCRERLAMRGGSRGGRGRYGTCGAAALIDLRGTGASGGGSGLAKRNGRLWING